MKNLYPNQQVVTSYCIGRIMYHNRLTKRVRVLHRLSQHHWVVKTHHEDDVMEYRGMMWSMSDAFN